MKGSHVHRLSVCGLEPTETGFVNMHALGPSSLVSFNILSISSKLEASTVTSLILKDPAPHVTSALHDEALKKVNMSITWGLFVLRQVGRHGLPILVIRPTHFQSFLLPNFNIFYSVSIWQ